MKKMMFLMLTLLIMGAASMNAQVTIGNENPPQDGAVLDLSKVSDQKLGLLLPWVSLTSTSGWQLRGSSTNGAGMLVYNINPDITNGNGIGVYLWDGVSSWEPLKSNFASAIKVVSFVLTPSATTVESYVGGTVSFTAGSFLPENATYQGVTWNITSGEDKASMTAQSMTGCSITGLAVGLATLTVVSIDENVPPKLVTIDVKECPKPAQPDGITGKNGSSGNEVYINQTGLTYSVTTPVDGVTYTWSSDDFILPSTKTGTSITVTVPATQGNYTITVTPSTSCGAGPAQNQSVLVSDLPFGSIVVPNARTNFVPGWPGTSSSLWVDYPRIGDLAVYPSNGPVLTTANLTAVAGYTSLSFDNHDASKFYGSNAGCAEGWRWPTAPELDAILKYLKANYGTTGGTVGVPDGWTELNGTVGTSTCGSQNQVNTSYVWHSWPVNYDTATLYTGHYTTSGGSVRCVKDL